jgi:hypothetical protein
VSISRTTCRRRRAAVDAWAYAVGRHLLGKLRNIGVAFAVAVLVVVMVLLATTGTGLVDRRHLNATLVRVGLPLLL